MKRLLDACADGIGRIVCTGDLTELQIAEARKDHRMYVDENGYGFVLLPWTCATARDLERDAPPVWRKEDADV